MLINPATLAIVDDHPIVLEGLQKLLTNVKSIQITGCFHFRNGFYVFPERK
ncbi:DNA-binding NarL/FixJ family response regulator [Chitinophaga sp. W2I13]|uniref:hypothetical protein n=1 Tax=Chitinophaga sp. W2I13 TaxID=3373923 RepID=UPI003D1BFFD3